MTRSLTLTIALAVLVVASGSCTIKRTFVIGQTHPANPDPSSIRLFIGELNAEHSEIAYVHSFTSDNKRVATRREQMLDLQKRAAKVGADAIMDVQLLAEDHRGVTLNRTTPLRTPRQGEFQRFFIRGTAVRIAPGETIELPSEAVPESPEITDEATIEAIPEIVPVPEVKEPTPKRAAY
jgi:uncharacterized protein YbjQ (UPF0145 family)